MHLPIPLLSLFLAITPPLQASPAPANPQIPSPQHILVDSDALPTEFESTGFRIPTRNESTVLARRLLAKSRAGVLSTIFPKNITSPYVPAAVANTPIGLPDYIASCEEPTGNPTLLALTISTSTRNAVAGSNVSLAISWWDEYVKLTHAEPWSAANLPRASLIGYLEEMTKEEVEKAGVVKCFTGLHGDSRWWLPGDKSAAHAGVWMRMVVEQVYWIGGFGDRAFIGWFDPEVWRGVRTEEWKAVRLPGEKD
ncbi:hypothetical protein LTR05_000171 [Lithohypha guttulata]|uniref:CREG-like beta-barrel domain-containing protein n=1 Tax=Lithohypha guttulata TaxID=1690604 RepID=A0AAN7YDK9_9EURO|nr:hypothetical protein LTR05_000171 [Lithohypha guttulata]